MQRRYVLIEEGRVVGAELTAPQALKKLAPFSVEQAAACISLTAAGRIRQPKNRYTCGATRFSILTPSRSSMISAIHCRWQCR